MSWWGPYSEPKPLGLTIVGEVDIADSYEFCMLVVWQHEDGRLFYGTDSGRSCPTPFEDVKRLEDLTVIDDLTAFEAAADAWLADEPYRKVMDGDRVDMHDLKRKVAAAFNEVPS